MLLVVENVAMPDVLMTARPGAYRIAHANGENWQIKLGDHRGYLTRVHADSVLPPTLVRVGHALCPGNRGENRCLHIKGCSLDDLDVDQMEMDGMGISGEIVDIPDFCAPLLGVSVA